MQGGFPPFQPPTTLTRRYPEIFKKLGKNISIQMIKIVVVVVVVVVVRIPEVDTSLVFPEMNTFEICNIIYYLTFNNLKKSK